MYFFMGKYWSREPWYDMSYKNMRKHESTYKELKGKLSNFRVLSEVSFWSFTNVSIFICLSVLIFSWEQKLFEFSTWTLNIHWILKKKPLQYLVAGCPAKTVVDIWCSLVQFKYKSRLLIEQFFCFIWILLWNHNKIVWKLLRVGSEIRTYIKYLNNFI